MEIFVEVVLFADRDTLDAMQLVSSFLLNFIRERELTQLALRDISSVKVGKFIMSDDYEGWLPCVEIAPGPKLLPKTVNQLALCIRMAFCQSFCIDFDGAPMFLESPSFGDIYGMIWDDLFAPDTFVGNLTIRMAPIDSVFIHIFEAFESVNSVNVEWLYDDPDFEPLEEDLFVSATEHGVRHITLQLDGGVEGDTPASTAGALSFGFAEPTAGGDRSLLGVACGIGPDFLAQIKQVHENIHKTHFDTLRIAAIACLALTKLFASVRP
ncbi:hypothetical protein AAVH_19623 [Aphelenchoides avenae]|nr:hypothetical protein AAVH_19623 [Aphelenchus avenae]